MIKKALVLFLMSIFIWGCNSNSKYQENLAKLDKVYGKCDNPYRTYRPLEYQICKDKERAAGPDGTISDPISISNILDFSWGKGNTVVSASDTNNFLWDASLKVLSSYSLKISDYEGGFIETNWIQNLDIPNERCLIKSHITSTELVSNGVDIKIICEKLIDDNWYNSKEIFNDEEKKITLQILKIANEISDQKKNS